MCACPCKQEQASPCIASRAGGSSSGAGGAQAGARAARAAAPARPRRRRRRLRRRRRRRWPRCWPRTRSWSSARCASCPSAPPTPPRTPTSPPCAARRAAGPMLALVGRSRRSKDEGGGRPGRTAAVSCASVPICPCRACTTELCNQVARASGRGRVRAAGTGARAVKCAAGDRRACFLPVRSVRLQAAAQQQPRDLGRTALAPP